MRLRKLGRCFPHSVLPLLCWFSILVATDWISRHGKLEHLGVDCMIELYTWGTPNGRKVSIALEELGMPYNGHPVDIMNGYQFTADVLELNPNNKIPGIQYSDAPARQTLTLF